MGAEARTVISVISEWDVISSEPLEQSDPPEPSDVERVGPMTQNPPTAAIPTAPEHPATLNMQMQQLASGIRKVVMFPPNSQTPKRYPPGVAITSDGLGNTYAYNVSLIKKAAIHSAARKNRLPEILGSTRFGMGSPDKSQLPPDAPVVTAHSPEGVEVQSTATSPASLPYTIAATRAVTPPGGRVAIVPPRRVLRARLYQGAPPPAPVEDFSAPSGF
jgi:hypothetical protein